MHARDEVLEEGDGAENSIRHAMGAFGNGFLKMFFNVEFGDEVFHLGWIAGAFFGPAAVAGGVDEVVDFVC